MALQLSIETPFGVDCPEAYWMITDAMMQIQVDEDTDEKQYVLMCQLAVYADKAARDAGASPISGGGVNMEIDLDGDGTQDNIIKQVYEFIKTLDDFDGATDV